MTTIEQLLAGTTAPRGGAHTTHPRAWRVSADSVYCEFGRKDPKGVAWEMLAYGLEYVERHQKGRLVLILPANAAKVCAWRSALLRPGLIEIWQYGKAEELVPVAVPTLEEALPEFGATREEVTFRPDPRDTGGLPAWMLDLGDWVESRAVERVRTDTYWAWHYRGRAVLTIAQTGGNNPKAFKVLGGVRYTGQNVEKYGDNTYTKFAVPVGESPTQEQVTAVRQQVDAAIERRRTKDDDGHREHMLQAAIGADPALIGMRHVRRELAAGRPTANGSALIDFLGIDDDGRLHVIETKLGNNDPQLGVQGLDYWAWATAHVHELQAQLEKEGHDHFEPARDINLRFVIGKKTKGRALHAAADATITALHNDIPWRVQVLENWDTLQKQHVPLSLPRDVGPQRNRTLP